MNDTNSIINELNLANYTYKSNNSSENCLLLTSIILMTLATILSIIVTIFVFIFFYRYHFKYKILKKKEKYDKINDDIESNNDNNNKDINLFKDDTYTDIIDNTNNKDTNKDNISNNINNTKKKDNNKVINETNGQWLKQWKNKVHMQNFHTKEFTKSIINNFQRVIGVDPSYINTSTENPILNINKEGKREIVVVPFPMMQGIHTYDSNQGKYLSPPTSPKQMQTTTNYSIYDDIQDPKFRLSTTKTLKLSNKNSSNESNNGGIIVSSIESPKKISSSNNSLNDGVNNIYNSKKSSLNNQSSSNTSMIYGSFTPPQSPKSSLHHFQNGGNDQKEEYSSYILNEVDIMSIKSSESVSQLSTETSINSIDELNCREIERRDATSPINFKSPLSSPNISNFSASPRIHNTLR
jgi:hypothetical protein